MTKHIWNYQEDEPKEYLAYSHSPHTHQNFTYLGQAAHWLDYGGHGRPDNTWGGAFKFLCWLAVGLAVEKWAKEDK